ncbi:hypothetical protein [Ferruginibacter sp. SUN106]|uniref:hypothetical protein n=1 Tax=Ferruginibacter sp. SUN106 TaxID=2978348 RepID=UPI003D36F502
MTRLLLVTALFSYFDLTMAQTTNFTVKQIDSIVKSINTTCISGGITDYTFHKKGQKKKTIGSGADWYYTDSSGKKLLKAVREVYITTEDIDAYYFYNDSLIYLHTTRAKYDSTKKTIITEGKYYFQNHTLICKEDNLKYPFKPEFYFTASRQFFGEDKLWRR